jgi:hypothetical protein
MGEHVYGTPHLFAQENNKRLLMPLGAFPFGQAPKGGLQACIFFLAR